MSLCRNYPIPSNRMAVMWSLTPIKNAVVLEYGPAGTTHFGAGFYGSFGINLENSLFTTHISEDDIVMGDVERLEKAILEVDESYHPEIIFVVASAVIAVIGTDIKGVCSYMQEKVKAKLICFDDGGFGGDYTAGLQNTYSVLVKEFALKENPEKESLKYNILGASAASYRIRSDIWEIKDLMSRAFQMEVNGVLGLEITLEQLKNMGGAAINLVLRKEALPAAELLKKKFGTPYIYSSPYGYQGTMEWVEKIGKELSKEIAFDFKKQLGEKIREVIGMSRMMMAVRMAAPPTASLIGDYDTILGLTSLCEEFNFTVDKKICNHSLKNTDAESYGIVNYKKESEKIEVLKEIKGQLVFGDEVSLAICDPFNTKVCVSFPYPSKVQIATHLPFMGERGADYLLEIIREHLSNMR